MKLITAVSLVSISLAGCGDTPDIALHKRLQKAAGKDAFDCGRATTSDENKQQSNCALEHLNHRAPFFVQYRVKGIDAISEEGLLLDGNGNLATIGTFSWGPAAPVGKFEVNSCDPSKLRKTSSEYLICY